MSNRGITLRRQVIERQYVPNRGEGVRLIVTTEDAVDMPTELFLHQQRLIDPVEGVHGPEFLSVASVFDLTIYPANEPDLYQFPQFYRLNTIDIVLPSLAALDEAWTAIYQEVCVLVESLNKLEILTVGETVRCGEPLMDSSSIPSSESIPSSISISASESE